MRVDIFSFLLILGESIQSFIIEYDVHCSFLLFLFFNDLYMIEEVSFSLCLHRISIMNGY